jgi:hypothetical protein
VVEGECGWYVEENGGEENCVIVKGEGKGNKKRMF